MGHNGGSFASPGARAGADCARPFPSGAAGAALTNLRRGLPGDRLRTVARRGLATAGQPCASPAPVILHCSAGKPPARVEAATRRRRAPARPRIAEPGSRAPLIGAQWRRCGRSWPRLEALRQAAAELALAGSCCGCGGRGGCHQGRQNRERAPDLTGTDHGAS